MNAEAVEALIFELQKMPIDSMIKDVEDCADDIKEYFQDIRRKQLGGRTGWGYRISKTMPQTGM